MRKLLTGCIIGAILASLTIFSACSQTPEGKLASVKDLLAQGRFDRAAAIVDDFVKADSAAPAAIYGQGLLLQYRGLGWDAMLKYLQASPMQNGYRPAMKAFLDIAIDLDYLANAHKMAVILNNRDPENPEWFMQSARIDIRQNAFDDARHSLDQADSLGADRSDMTLARAELAFRSNDSDSITQALGRLMQVRLANADQYDRLASLYRYMNMLDSAVAAERRAADKAPQDIKYRLQLAQYLFDQRHLHESKEIVQKLLADTKSYGPALVLDAYILWAMGDNVNADLQFLKFMDLNKETPISLEKNGDFYAYFDKLRLAQTAWQSAYTLAGGMKYPDDYIARVFIKMENAFLDSRDLFMAVDYFEEGRDLLGDLPEANFFEAELKSNFPETVDSAKMMVDDRVKKNWDNQHWLELAGRYFYRSRRYDQAVEVYKRLVELPSPKEVYVLNWLNIYEKHDNWQAVDTLAENLPIRLRGSRDILEKLYEVYAASQRPDEAIPYAEKLYNLSPGYMPYVQNLAQLYARKDRIDDAHKLFTTYVSSYPDDPEGYYCLGHFEFDHDMVDSVPDRFAKALAIDTGYAYGYQLKGLYWERKGNFDSATYYYRRTISYQKPTPEAYHNLAEYYYKKGDSLDYAAGLAMAAVRYFTNDRRGYLLLGNIYYKQDKYKLARLQYTKGLTLFPGDAEFQFLLGKAHMKLNEKAKAKEYLQDALKNNLPEPQRAEAEKLLAQL